MFLASFEAKDYSLDHLAQPTGALMRCRAAGQGAAADNAAVLPPQAAYTCLRGGAPGGAAVRWQGFASLQITARARLGMGFANPSLQGARGVRRNAPAPHRGAVAQRPGASRRSISSSEDQGKRDRATRAVGKTGGGALATSHSAPE